MQLRIHQVKAVDAMRDSFRRGNKRIVLSAPPSMGKTLIACHAMMEAVQKNPSLQVVFFVDRLKLLSQTTATLEKLGCYDYSVLQGDDPRYNPEAKITVASLQTALSRKNLMFHLAFVDECHTLYKGLTGPNGLMRRLSAIHWVGLTATPFAKGMAADGLYEDLIVTTTPRQLMADGWLSPTDYYIGKTADFTGVATKRLSTGGTDYDPEELGKRMMADESLAGDIVKNYIKHSDGLRKRAVCFAPSIAYSKSLVERFNKEIGYEIAVHIDGYMDAERERKLIYQDFEDGHYKIICNSRILNTGWDDPSCEIAIDCFKTKSETVWCQRIGRIWRIAPGKDRAIVLDHAGNLDHFGCFPEDIVPVELDDGDRKFSEKKQIKKEEKELAIHECDQCGGAFTGLRCKCGFELPLGTKVLRDDGSSLVKVTKLSGSAKRRKDLTKEQKQQWYSSLLWYGREHNYKSGWAYHKYKEAMSCFPNGLAQKCKEPSAEVLSWIKSRQIRWSKRA